MKRMLRLVEVEQRLGVSRWCIYDWIQEGKVDAIKLPTGHYRIPEEVVERLEHAQWARIDKNTRQEHGKC